jgi:hypothetical protein
MEEKTLPAPIVEPTCVAFGTNKKQPHASKAGKIKRDPAVRGPTPPNLVSNKKGELRNSSASGIVIGKI